MMGLGSKMFETGDMHPMRFRRTRPFAKEFATAILKQNESGHATMSAVNTGMAVLMRKYNDAVGRLPLEVRPNDASNLLTRETTLGVKYARFCGTGRNVFAVSPVLREMLEFTSLEGVLASDLSLPFNFFYIALGPDFPGSLPGPPNEIDGAYVDVVPGGTIQITITSRRLDVDTRKAGSWPLSVDTYYNLDIQTDDQTPLDEAFNRHVDGELARLAEGYRSTPEDLERMSAETGRHIVTGNGAKRQAAALVEGRSEALLALRTIGNALCYLSAGPELGTPQYPADTPPAELQVLQSGAKTARQAATARLLDGGFSLVRWLGPQRRTDAESDGPHAQGGVRPHWRRGHWRRQAYGSGLVERRLIWIRPVVVNSSAGAPDVGHIYDVTAPNGA